MKSNARDFRELTINALPNLIFILIVLAFWYLTIGSAPVLGEGTNIGKITGSVISEETGEPLPGASVMLHETSLGVATDLNGQFNIGNVPPGDYDLMIHMIGFAKTTIKGVHVIAGQAVEINVPLKSDALTVKDVLVEAKLLKNTEAALLKNRQRSNAVSDAISSEEISRAGSGDAAEAMQRVTGASVVGGKYVLVRGLGERYSSAQLNGAELPSADPDKKAFQMDLLPSNLLANIVTIKSFTPDQPGNFTGGIVDIGTKTFPEAFTLRLSTSGSDISGTTHNKNFLSYAGGGKDWMGMDNGFRGMPDEVKDGAIPLASEAMTDADKAHKLDRISKSFNNVMAPKTEAAPINRNFALSIGNQISFLGRKLGYLGSLSYNRSYSFYQNGEFAKWELTSQVDQTDQLGYSAKFNDTQGSSEAIWGGLAMLSYSLHPRHQISANFLYTQSGESTARYLTGELPSDLSEDQQFETRVLKYTERNLQSIQVTGSHDFSGFAGLRIDWLGAYSENTQDEPDLRFFSDRFEVFRGDTIYGVSANTGFTYPQRIWRNLSEDNSSFDIKVSKPFKQWSGLGSAIRLGGALSQKNRTYRQRIFEYNNDDQGQYGYNGNPDYYFSDENIGLMDSSYGFYRFANYIVERSTPRGNYDGEQEIKAAFAMLEMPLSAKLRFAGGTRYEQTRIDCVTQDTTVDKGKLRNNDMLPSASFVYQLLANVNFRVAYGKTLARPTFRELAPYATYEFVSDYTLIGNPNLKRTLIDNYDLRLEWFPRPGEIIAASGFYKDFANPIERSILNNNGEVGYQNVSSGMVYGFEFEMRQKLDRIAGYLSNLSLGANASLIGSKVKIPDRELEVIRAADSNAGRYRQLWGQSPYIVNLELAYSNEKSGSVAGLNYNVNGKRLSTVTMGATPDIFELPQPSLNLSLSQKLPLGFEMKFSARNLLNSSYRLVQTFKGKDYISAKHQIGRSLGLGISYNIG